MKHTQRFETCLKIVINNEGGYSDHPADSGKATNYGVTQNTYDRHRLSIGLKLRPVKEIEWSEVSNIYYSYWVSANCEKYPEPLDLLVMDFAINSGASRAVKTLQQCLGVMVDGIFGRNSITAMANYITMHGIDNLCDRYLEEREEFFRNIVVRDGSQMVFLKGWLNRIKKLRKETGID